MEVKKEVFAKIWEVGNRTYGDLLVNKAKISPFNVRPKIQTKDVKELATSIRNEGLLQLPLCTPEGEIFVGGRRLKACKDNKQKLIPVEIRDYIPTKQLRASLAENMRRQSLSVTEEGKALKNIRDKEGISCYQMAKEGIDSETASYIKIKIYEEFEEKPLARGEEPIEVKTGHGGRTANGHDITYSKAQVLIPLSKEDRETLINKIQTEGLNQSQLTTVVRKAKKIRKLLLTMQDEKKKEQLEKTIEPMIFEKEMTAEVAEQMVLQIEGLLVKTPKVLIALYDILPKIQNFCKIFPKFAKYSENTTEDYTELELKVKIPKKLMESETKEEKKWIKKK